MATTSADVKTDGPAEEEDDEGEDKPSPWILARHGVSLLLNNKQEEAEHLFTSHPQSLEMNAGYAYAIFTDALMSFEEDKIQQALHCLKDLEKKCIANTSSGWLRSMRSKVFGADTSNVENQLGSQIVLADCYVFVAALTFLQQDISGFIKASWILRKAYKHYQNAYNTITEMRKDLPDSLKADKSKGKKQDLKRKDSKMLFTPNSDDPNLEESDPDVHVELVNVDMKAPVSDAESIASHAVSDIQDELALKLDDLLNKHEENPSVQESPVVTVGSDGRVVSGKRVTMMNQSKDTASADTSSPSASKDVRPQAVVTSPKKTPEPEDMNPTEEAAAPQAAEKAGASQDVEEVVMATPPVYLPTEKKLKEPKKDKKDDKLPCVVPKFPANTPSGMIRNGYMVIPSFSSSLGSSDSKHSISYHAGLSSFAGSNKQQHDGTQDQGYVLDNSPIGQRDTVFSDADRSFRPMRKSRSAHDDISTRPATSTLTTSLSYLTSPLNLFNHRQFRKVPIEPEALNRLLCQASFGFGLLQLGISLLPPSVLKLINFFGFAGNRKTGLDYLMHARKGEDMRAPFATLALLWYHTIVRPFFALDGNNVQAGVTIAGQLIDETQEEFSESALFLFFKGRVERLSPDIQAAILAFQQAISNASQREVKVMAMHEVGWCYLIELDYHNAEITFLCLKQSSRWSRPFYSYIAMVAAGARRQFQETENPMDLRNYFLPVTKGTQLDEFLIRRYKTCPMNATLLKELNVLFWKLLAYEMLYLWNTLPSCSFRVIDKITSDCVQANDLKVEPFIGLGKLIEGSCHCILGRIAIGKACFRDCHEIRKHMPVNCDDAHVSAFADYELGLLLLKDRETASEGRRLLEHAAGTYKGYDFEQRLTVRVHAILKNA